VQVRKDMHDKKQVTVKMTEQFANDLNLVMRTYGLTDLSYVVRESVAAQAAALRLRLDGHTGATAKGLRDGVT
jgi:hypothetical protein